MSSILEIILRGEDQTAPAFASAQANLANFIAMNGRVSQTVQRTTATQRQATTAAQQQARADAQLAALAQRVAAAQTDAAGRVRLYTQAMQRATVGSRDYLNAQLKLIAAQKEVARGTGGLSGIGGQILGGLGLAGGISMVTQQVVALGQESTGLAIKAETIGRAYEGATQRAGVSADQLLRILKQASRGTVSETGLMLSANKALALGVGQDAQQIGDLLAIARQKGKDFGIGTEQAFEDIVTGLGRASPLILDNLGIVIDLPTVYKDYATALSKTASQLTEQEKKQALVNEVIRSGTQLIKDNANAELDAADKFAQAQTIRQQALTRAGTAGLPAMTAGVLAGAGGIDLLTGGLSAGDLFAGASQGKTLPERALTLVNNLQQLGNASTSLSAIFRILAASEEHAIKTIEEEADQHERNAAAARANRAALAAVPQFASIGFAGFGATPQRVPFAPGGTSQGGIVWTGNQIVQGSVVTDLDLAERTRHGLQQIRQANGYEVLP